MKTFKVYMHINKLNNKKYIGITSQNVNARWRNGKGYFLGYGKRTYFYNAIVKYGWDGFEHIILYDGLTDCEAKNKEIELIKLYDTTNRDFGYNLSKGGDLGCYRINISDKEKKRRSEYMKNRVVSNETKLRMSKAKTNSIPWNKEETGIYSEEYKNKISRARKVIDVYGNVFNSVKECAEHYDIDRANLNAYIIGRVNTPKKYKRLCIKYFDEGM